MNIKAKTPYVAVADKLFLLRKLGIQAEIGPINIANLYKRANGNSK